MIFPANSTGVKMLADLSENATKILDLSGYLNVAAYNFSSEKQYLRHDASRPLLQQKARIE
jgi:hypothetical protein